MKVVMMKKKTETSERQYHKSLLLFLMWRFSGEREPTLPQGFSPVASNLCPRRIHTAFWSRLVLRERPSGRSYYCSAGEYRAWGNTQICNAHPKTHKLLSSFYETMPRTSNISGRIDTRPSDPYVSLMGKDEDIVVDGITFRKFPKSQASLPAHSRIKMFYYMKKDDIPQIGSVAPDLDNNLGALVAHKDKRLSLLVKDFCIEGQRKDCKDAYLSRERERGRDRARSVLQRKEKVDRKASRSRSRSRGKKKLRQIISD